VEVTRVLTLVSEAGCVAAAPRGEESPFVELSVYAKSRQFQARTHLMGVNVNDVRSKRG
jgi:hypothetical protein